MCFLSNKQTWLPSSKCGVNSGIPLLLYSKVQDRNSAFVKFKCTFFSWALYRLCGTFPESGWRDRNRTCTDKPDPIHPLPLPPLVVAVIIATSHDKQTGGHSGQDPVFVIEARRHAVSGMKVSGYVFTTSRKTGGHWPASLSRLGPHKVIGSQPPPPPYPLHSCPPVSDSRKLSKIHTCTLLLRSHKPLTA